jgi:hypothetical protein
MQILLVLVIHLHLLLLIHLARLQITVTYVNCCLTALLGTLLLFLHLLLLMDANTLSYCAGTYSIHQNIQSPSGSLIDGGANGGLSGSDVVVLYETLLTADVTGIVDNTLQKIPVCTVAGLIQTQHGPIIGVFHQYAHQGTGKTIHSVSQLRHFGTIVDDTPRLFGGKQRLETLDGYIIPLSIRSGLPYTDMSPPTQEELDTYPHVSHRMAPTKCQ